MFLRPVRKFYSRYERPISSLSLVAGFVFDAVTLRRVDELRENIWILAHLLVVSVVIVLIHSRDMRSGGGRDPGQAHFWYVNILQFFFGGILSTFLVFYFRAADIFVTWPFILLLAGAFLANESLKRHYVRFSFQISLLYLSVYSFTIYLLPVVLHRIGTGVFILSGIAALAFIGLFIFALSSILGERFRESKYLVAALIIGITAVVNALYFTNLIPPIPLSLKSGGVYHSVQKDPAGNYDVTYQPRGWRDYLDLYPDFAEPPGAPAYAFSAVFSPENLDITIVHEWQHYDPAAKKWVTAAAVRLPVRGGRGGGFRTYSMRSALAAGRWRVNIKTEGGKIIGRLRFTAVPSDAMPALSSKVE